MPSRGGAARSRRTAERVTERIAVVSPFMEEAQPIGPEKRKRQGNPPRNPTREDSTSMLSKLLQVWTAAANKVRLAQSEYSVLRQNCLVAALEKRTRSVKYTWDMVSMPALDCRIQARRLLKQPIWRSRRHAAEQSRHIKKCRRGFYTRSPRFDE